MNEHSSVEDLTTESAAAGKDSRTRKILLALLVLWLLTLLALVGIAWKSYFQQKATSQTLAQQIQSACESKNFGPGLSSDDENKLCSNAEKVIKNDNLAPLAGPQGERGPQGEQGPMGPQGIQGPPGFDGKAGLMGQPGSNGKDGLSGANGLDGSPGKDGLNGEPGATGAQGPQGEKGETGPAGEKGEKGDPGQPGVVNVATVGCDGPLIRRFVASYDPATQTITITCNG